MTGLAEKAGSKRSLPRMIAAVLAGIVLFLVSACLLLLLALRTPFAADQASRLLTHYLHHPATVTALGFTGTTLIIEGIGIANPAGFPGKELASVKEVAIRPDWLALLDGKRRLARLKLRGLEVTLAKNEQGRWNVTEFIRRIPKKKEDKEAEIFVGQLVIEDSAVHADGFRFGHLALDLHNLSTKGSDNARFLLTCTDNQGNPLRLQGVTRPGTVPSADIQLSAPAFSLATFARPGTPAPAWARGTGSLLLSVKVQDRAATAAGTLGVKDVALPVGKETVPIAASLSFTGRYDAGEDRALLDSFSLQVNDLVRLTASGSVLQVRSKRTFSATVSLAPLDISAASVLLPQEVRRKLVLRGTAGPAMIRIAGDAATGITAGSGGFSLRQGEAATGKRTVVAGVAIDVSAAKEEKGWQVRGRIRSGRQTADAIVQGLEAPFTALLSSRLKPLQAELPNITAEVYAIPASGNLFYRPGPQPFTLRVDLRQPSLDRLQQFLGKTVELASGTAGISLEAKGRGTGNFTGTLTADVVNLKGRTSGRPFSAGIIHAGLDLRRQAGAFAGSGNARCGGAVINGKPAEGALSYGIRDRNFDIRDALVKLDGTELRIASLGGELPLPVAAGGQKRVPLRLQATGITARNGAGSVAGVSGELAADYFSEGGRQWLHGTGRVSAATVSIGGKETGTVSGGFDFFEKGASADLDGSLFGGRLSGTVRFSPFDPVSRSDFAMRLSRARGDGVGAVLPAGVPMTVKDGELTVTASGTHERDTGVQCRVEAEGKAITLARPSGKTLIRNGGFRTVAELAGETLLLRDSSFDLGAGVVVHARGKLAHPFSPNREGSVSFSSAATTLDSLFTSLLHTLPRSIQEASVSGTIGADGLMKVAGKQLQLDAAISLEQAGLEIPSQKVVVTGMTGIIPVSVAFAGPVQRPKKQEFSRDTFASRVAALETAAGSQRSCIIANIAFGGMETGETALLLKAGNGITELVSLRSALFGGALLGDGFFSYGDTMQYGVDLAVANLSLRALCDTYPSIRGYLSGKVDGIVSLFGEGAGVNGLHGFTEIWAHAGPDEKMLVSKEFLQKLAGKNLRGLFFRNDRPYDRGEIRGYLQDGYLTFDTLDISHTNFFGIRDLSVTVAPVQNRIALGHLFTSIREAATRGKPGGGGGNNAAEPPVETEFKWQD